MNDLDKWAAEQCGFHLRLIDETWTIINPVCREIVRETLRLQTMPSGLDGWACLLRDEIVGAGKTIPEAEIACIKAIKEVLEDQA